MLKKRIIVSLMSTVIFSVILAFIMYTPLSKRQPDTWYDPLGAPLPFLLIITGAAYLIGGVPVSSLIDKHVHNEIIKLPVYLIAGFIIGCLTIMLSFRTISIEVIWFGIYGVAGSLTFFIMMTVSKAFKKTSSRNGNIG